MSIDPALESSSLSGKKRFNRRKVAAIIFVAILLMTLLVMGSLASSDLNLLASEEKSMDDLLKHAQPGGLPAGASIPEGMNLGCAQRLFRREATGEGEQFMKGMTAEQLQDFRKLYSVFADAIEEDKKAYGLVKSDLETSSSEVPLPVSILFWYRPPYLNARTHLKEQLVSATKQLSESGCAI